MLSVVVQLQSQVNTMLGAVKPRYRITDEEHYQSWKKGKKRKVVEWTEITKEMSPNFILGEDCCNDWDF